MRISSELTYNNLDSSLSRLQSAQSTSEKKLTTQNKLQNPSDDPVHFAQATTYDSILARFHQYKRNIDAIHNHMTLQTDYLNNVNSSLQKIRNLTIQAANGIYTQSDRAKIAQTVDAELKNILMFSNKQDGEGNYLFAGANSHTQPFLALHNRVNGQDRISQVLYQGGHENTKQEVSDLVYIKNNQIGDAIFWGTPTKLTAVNDASYYRVPAQSTIQIDGQKISFSQGDTIEDVIKKINQAPIGVKAQLGIEGQLSLETTYPHNPYIADLKGNVLETLGLISSQTPDSRGLGVQQEGNSLFSSIIYIRDAMLDNKPEKLSRGLADLDQGMDNIRSYETKLGSKMNRLETIKDSIGKQEVDFMDFKNQDIGVDIAKESLNYKNLFLAYNSLLEISNQLFSTNLLKFLR